MTWFIDDLYRTQSQYLITHMPKIKYNDSTGTKKKVGWGVYAKINPLTNVTELKKQRG